MLGTELADYTSISTTTPSLTDFKKPPGGLMKVRKTASESQKQLKGFGGKMAMR